jgi:DNA-binding CsgD family transcriptional regulator
VFSVTARAAPPDRDPRELIAGVHSVAYLSPALAARMIGKLRDGGLGRSVTARARVRTLTKRERDVLALLGAGLSNAQIAHRLNLVEGTVKGHVSAILTGLGLANRVQAAILAHDAGSTAPLTHVLLDVPGPPLWSCSASARNGGRNHGPTMPSTTTSYPPRASQDEHFSIHAR